MPNTTTTTPTSTSQYHVYNGVSSVPISKANLEWMERSASKLEALRFFFQKHPPFLNSYLSKFKPYDPIKNPLLQLWCDANVHVAWSGEDVEGVGIIGERAVAASRYAFAIPCERALITISTQISQQIPSRKLLEIGAGKGYWAKLLSEKNVECTAIDNGSEYHAPEFFPVIKADGLQYMQEHRGCADSALLFCWPRKTMAVVEIIREYKGNLIFFVSDKNSCFDLHSGLLGGDWVITGRVELPRWVNMHDELVIWRRF